VCGILSEPLELWLLGGCGTFYTISVAHVSPSVLSPIRLTPAGRLQRVKYNKAYVRAVLLSMSFMSAAEHRIVNQVLAEDLKTWQ
jgi:hypothetical protein